MRQLELEAARRRAHRARVDRLLTLARKHPDTVMSDMGAFFGSGVPNQQIFYPTHASGATATWQIWDKPRGCTMVFFNILSGGAGGGGGFTGIPTSARGGGSGGGSGSRVKAFVPAILIPDRLYIQVGKGGAGSTGSGVAGTAGENSLVSVYQSGSVNAYIGFAQGGTGGGAGAASGATVGGGTGTPQLGTSFIAGMALGVASSGQTGGAGGNATGTAGSAVTVGVSAAGTTAGSGGGGTTNGDSAGGAQTSPITALFPTVAGAVAGSNRGTDGYWTWGPFYVGGFGGTGGGAANSGAGGGGGNGAYGCGGGGGGGGTTGGPGGNGGDGMIMLVAI